MSYIKELYPEIKALVSNGMPVSHACAKIKEKHNYDRTVEGMRKAYKAYDEKVSFEEGYQIHSQNLDAEGNVIGERRTRKPLKDNIDESKYDPFFYTVDTQTGRKWIRFAKLDGYTPDELKAELDKRIPAKIRSPRKRKGRGKGVFMLGDFHLGAYVGDLLKTPDFNFDSMCKMLLECVKKINSHQYKEVHLFMVGDFIESFSGLNHRNSWKGLSKGAYGMKAVILAHEILRDYLFSKINNLKYVGFVSGNHDRISSDKNEDAEGQVVLARIKTKMQRAK